MTILKKLILLIFLKNCICSVLYDQNKRTLEKAKEILDKYPLIDGHNDLAYLIREIFQNRIGLFDLNDLFKDNPNGTNFLTHTDIKRIRTGKLTGQFWAIFAECKSLAKDAVRIHLEQIDVMKRIIEKYPNDFQHITTSAEIEIAFKNKKTGSLFGMESGHAIDSSLAVLRMFYELGVRYMTLTHNCDVPWSSNNLVDRFENASLYGGLTQFGRKVIREMNRLGMIVDLSHVSYQTMLDSLEESKAPVMFSHSSVYAICNHTRNVRDDVLEKLKKNRGIIMINFYNGFVKCRSNNVNVQDVVEHFNYVKNRIGVDNIGIGADYDGVNLTPDKLEDVSGYPNLFSALLNEGWSENELAKISSGNLIRVFSEVENYAKSVQNMEPLDDIIESSDIGEIYKDCRTSF